jgi:DMSO/TMAO reductase YedYZ molybdopterin-dependent catalytic subunit
MMDNDAAASERAAGSQELLAKRSSEARPACRPELSRFPRKRGLARNLPPRSQVAQARWTVERPRALTYDELTALPRADQVSTFHCVTGWTVKNVHWGGVRFQQLFDLVQPLPSATAVRFVSMERPYEDSLTLEQLRLPDAMLTYRLGGQALSRPHGAPARVILPEMYGYKGVKWLTGMEFVAKQPRGYWEQHGYDQNAWVGRSNGHHSS